MSDFWNFVQGNIPGLAVAIQCAPGRRLKGPRFSWASSAFLPPPYGETRGYDYGSDNGLRVKRTPNTPFTVYSPSQQPTYGINLSIYSHLEQILHHFEANQYHPC